MSNKTLIVILRKQKSYNVGVKDSVRRPSVEYDVPPDGGVAQPMPL